jgi:hypothetical protein
MSERYGTRLFEKPAFKREKIRPNRQISDVKQSDSLKYNILYFKVIKSIFFGESGLVTGYELNSTFYPRLSRLVTGGHGLSQLFTV